jgi:hypothetical protein
MKKTLKKLVLDRETIKPLVGEDLDAVNGGLAMPPAPGPSVGFVCSNCTPPFPRPNPSPSLPRPNPLSLPQNPLR